MDHKDEIASIAYEIYVKSGKIEGRDLDNWLEAERLVLGRNKKTAPVAELRHTPPERQPVVTTPKPKERTTAPRTAGKKGRR